MGVTTYQFHRFWHERKAPLRRVELELDEVDDIVHSPSVNAHKNLNLTVLSRYLNWTRHPGHSVVG